MSVLLNSRGLPPTFSWKQFLPSDKKTVMEHSNRRGHRKIFISPRMISKSRGSCYLECGNTKIVAAVYGPRENLKSDVMVMEGKLSCQFVISPFATPGAEVADERDTQKVCSDYETFIEECFCSVVDRTKFPKSTLDLTVLVLENDGGVLAHSLTALSCAITSAGMEMHDMLVGVNCAVMVGGGDEKGLTDGEQEEFEIAVDPCFEDETISYQTGSDRTEVDQKILFSTSVVTVGYLPNVNQIATLSHNGQCPSGQVLSTAVKKCIENSPLVYAAVQKFLKQSLLDDES